MKKRHLVAINLINLLVIVSYVECIQLDNELVSKPQHCFERIALGYMLPFNATFRKTDTNILDKCLNLCLNDIECVTFAFGISARGNGTCQLSNRPLDPSKMMQSDTIFDPDFDLYARKTSNCLVDPRPSRGPTQVPRPGGFDKNPGSSSGSTNLQPSRPTQSSFPPTGITGRPTSSVFIPPSTSGSYSTDMSDGSTAGDFSTTPFGGSSYPDTSSNTRPSSLSPEDPYTANKYPSTFPTANRNPQIGNQPDENIPTTPTDTNRPPPSHQNHPQPVSHDNLPHQPPSYPAIPDPFPDYFPHIHPHYHFNLDHDYTDEKDSHFTGIYAHNAPSLHNRYYPAPSYSHIDHYGGLYPAGRYPDSDVHLTQPGYGGNRKNGYQVTDNSPDVPMSKACFRRVLAGKRVATHWVRRTLICERLEDCQRECGDEKRFSCEGFNYRLDPSGRGQGECELIEVPLSRMDLYSSPHNRDSNLIPHPDYDYYERDRTTANCRASPCIDCGANPGYAKPTTFRPPQSNYKPSYETDRYRPEVTAIDKYRPQNNYYESRPGSDSWDRFGGSNYFASGGDHHYNRPPPAHYPDARPYGFNIDRYGTDDGGSDYFNKPPPHRPMTPPSSGGGYIDSSPNDYGNRPLKPYHERPQSPPRPISPESDYGNRPLPVAPLPHKPSTDYDRPDPPYRPLSQPESSSHGGGYGSGSHHEPPLQSPPPRPGIGYLDREPPPSNYHHRPSDYHPTNFHQKPSSSFIPYLIGQDNNWGMYGGTYGSSSGSISYRPQLDYWGLRNEIKRKDGPQPFNYYELGPIEDNSVHNRYGGPMTGSGSGARPISGYGERPSIGYGERPSSAGYGERPISGGYGDRSSSSQSGMNWGQMWTRRPGVEECSVKTSEGFRLHKGVVRNAFSVSNIKDCEKMCYSEDKFRCSVFSYRYSDPSNNNCLLCDRSFSLLDSYADIVPDKNFDIYAMSDDTAVCKKEPLNRGEYGSSNNDQCFVRTIDTKRLFESIVRDTLTVRSIGECEIECIKAKTFTCRSFSFRYGAKVSGTIIDNCQLSDWPVRDMDKDRHLISDPGFDVFERASYGKGCEIQPFEHDHDHKSQKLCYLGYGSAAKLLASAIKKVISVTSELECKNECIRYRETSQFKCLSFSFGSQASTFNCDMSDLDQSELKLDVHYTHTPNRDYWLFAWNPFDYTCRDKITSISGNRINSERRMDIFRDTGGHRHLTVSGKACRVGTKCEKNHIAGFYSCELEGGEVGSWDFCCREDHPCGFSRDFDYSWCYVGVEKEQWRSCSVSYIPVHTQQGSFSSHSFTSTRYPDKKNDIFQSPPRPGGLHGRDLPALESQLLPIQYLYHDGPPNATQISNNIIDCNREKC